MEACRAEWPLLVLRGRAAMMWSIVALLWLAPCMAQPVAAQQPDVACQQTGTDKRRLECAVRLEPPREIRSVSAAVVGSARTLPEPVIDRYPAPGDITATLVVLDISDRARNATVRANAEDLTRMVRAAASHHRIGLATLPGSGSGPEPSLDVRAQIGSDIGNIERRLAEVRATGLASPIYRSTIEGIRLLKSYPAQRHVLLLVSDGKAGDTFYRLENVIDEARRQRVAVYAFGVAERGGDIPDLQALIRLAEGTGGRYWQADLASRHFAPATLDSALKQIDSDSGARVTVDLTGVAADQTVELTFRTGDTPPPTHRYTVQGPGTETAGASSQAPPATSTPVVPQMTEAAPAATSTALGAHSVLHKPGWFARQWNWIRANPLVSSLAGIALLLLLLSLIVWSVRAARRRQRVPDRVLPASSSEETYRVRPSDAQTAEVERKPAFALASLQPVLNGGPSHPVNAEMVTIGRAANCNIRLQNETVSAHHATLVRKRDGFFELTDMGSRNGVRVNGERVNRKRVSPGDLIDIGGEKFRFVVNQPERAG